jgi:hypothetical protein
MTKTVFGILGAVAVLLTCGAVQFASGSDLVASARDASQDLSNQNGINRGAKADRADGIRMPVGPSQTISVRLDGLSGTSILIRLPAQFREEARNRSSIPGLPKDSATAHRTVACEPVVSVLTEVAKQLQPGRCIT